MSTHLKEIELEGHTLGLLSDSHGEHERTARAIDMLVGLGVDAILHMGDICSESVLDSMAGAPVPIRFVWGNMDEGFVSLENYARDLGMICDHPAGRYSMSATTIIATHGHLEWVQAEAISLRASYLIHGHTHTVRDERIGDLRILNPGALHRASRYTVGVLELKNDSFKIHELD